MKTGGRVERRRERVPVKRKGAKGTGKAKRRPVVLLAVIAAAVACVFLLYYFFGRPKTLETLRAGELPAEAAQTVIVALPKDEAGEPDSQALVFDLNPRPEFAGGGSPCPLNIVNPWNNYYAIDVEISDNETGDILYSSGLLQPGESIPQDKLNARLSTGEYPAVAHVFAYDPQTNERVLETSSGLTIIVN